ncbi:restriction endonuclease subunit S [Microbacterium sp. A84]|uniref:restriction endonuclease subunit S n=1 Tax=Microbacterium sp. A84 TaxID=3450715 RepID=UPI003F41F369
MNAPEGWASGTLGAHVDLLTGFAFDSNAYSAVISDVRLLRGDNVLPQKLRWEGVKRWSLDSSDALSRYALNVGDTVIAMDRTWIAAGAKVASVKESDLPCLLVQRVARLRAKHSLDQAFMHQLVSGHAFEEYVKSAKTETAVPHISPRDIRGFRVLLPLLSEQRKIAEILRTWDDAIDRSIVLRDHLAMRFESIARNLLTPEAPASRHLSEMTAEISTRNAVGQLDRNKVMGVSNRRGLVPMRAQTIAGDISRYQVLPPRAFAYNPMRINVGSIAMSTFTYDVLVSPDYVLFECYPSELIPSYLDHVLSTSRWRHYVNAGAAGSVRTRTYYNDLAAISIHTPPPDEQARIVSILDTAKAEINLLNRNLELLRTQKRGLMQKLLTGEVRVAPKETE